VGTVLGLVSERDPEALKTGPGSVVVGSA
jgi:hypothetical protein